jgi:hypothetical protein
VEVPWLLTSAAEGLTKYSIPLLEGEEAPARYSVTMVFAELNPQVQPGERVFNVSLQDKTVLEDFDIAGKAGGSNRQLIRTFDNVEVRDRLLLTMSPSKEKTPGNLGPLLNAIKIVRSEEAR